MNELHLESERRAKIIRKSNSNLTWCECLNRAWLEMCAEMQKELDVLNGRTQ